MLTSAFCPWTPSVGRMRRVEAGWLRSLKVIRRHQGQATAHRHVTEWVSHCHHWRSPITRSLFRGALIVQSLRTERCSSGVKVGQEWETTGGPPILASWRVWAGCGSLAIWLDARSVGSLGRVFPGGLPVQLAWREN